MVTSEFGREYDHDGHKLILPRDVEWRKELFGEDVIKHPAKMQLHIVKACIKYYEESGLLTSWSIILDPFGGTGTTSLAAATGYTTWLIEIEPIYIDLLNGIKAKWRQEGYGEWAKRMVVYSGDCRQVMKSFPDNSIDLIITSPPYSVTAQVGKEVTKFTGVLAERKAQMREYGSSEAHPLNIGRLNPFQFEQQMRKVYAECARVLTPKGRYISVTKDRMVGGVRQYLKTDVIRSATDSGLVYTGEWWKWVPPGGLLQNIMKAKGAEVVEDEDIIALGKA